MSRCLSVLIGFIFLCGAPSFAIADAFCWLRTESPQDAKMGGPIPLGSDWKKFKLTKPFKVAPSIHYVHVVLKPTDFEFVDLTNRDEHIASWNRWLPKNLKTGEIQIFEVRVHNTKLGWIDLVYSPMGKH